jgi:hypothetical protein
LTTDFTDKKTKKHKIPGRQSRNRKVFEQKETEETEKEKRAKKIFAEMRDFFL